MEELERFARQHARNVAMTKTAGIGDRFADFLANKAAVGGAAAGAVIGGTRGAQGSREGEKGYGALTGAALGAVSGGILGAGGRSLFKKVPEGFKQRKEGLKALEEQYMKSKRVKTKPTEGAALSDFKSGLKEYREGVMGRMRKAEDLASAGKHGKEAREAIDAVRAQAPYAPTGQFMAGREKLRGGLLGGALGVGYGAYQLKGTSDINKSSDYERALKGYVDSIEKRSEYDPAHDTADRVGRLMATLSV
jgi:hypothetical protein